MIFRSGDLPDDRNRDPQGSGAKGSRDVFMNSLAFIGRRVFGFHIGGLGLDSALSNHADTDSPFSGTLRASLVSGDAILRGILPGNQADPLCPDGGSPPRG